MRRPRWAVVAEGTDGVAGHGGQDPEGTPVTSLPITARARRTRHRPTASAAGRDAASAAGRDAVRAIVPLALGVLPFATVLGVALSVEPVPAGAAVAATGVLYAGSAQLAAMTALGDGAGVLAAVAVATLLNARFLLYGAALAGRFAHQPAWFRWLGPAVIVDQTYAAATTVDPPGGPAFRRFWLTAASVLAGVYLSGVVVGIAIGSVIPAHPAWSMAVPCTLIALLAPRLVERRVWRVAGVAAVVALAARGLPAGLGIVLAIAIGMACAPRPASEHTDDAADDADDAEEVDR
jgi:predicted branched-subunit amino acid permease